MLERDNRYVIIILCYDSAHGTVNGIHYNALESKLSWLDITFFTLHGNNSQQLNNGSPFELA